MSGGVDSAVAAARAVDAGHGGTDGQALFRGLLGQLTNA